MTSVQVSHFAVASSVMETRFVVLLSFFFFKRMIENPNPCLMCCSVRNYPGLSGLLGRAKQHFIAMSTNTCDISTHGCILLESVANSQKTRRTFQPSALLNLCLMCISLPRYSKQCITFLRIYLRLALQCTLTLILLFYSISAYYLLFFYPVQVTVICPCYIPFIL